MTQLKKDEGKDLLFQYLPEETVDTLWKWIVRYKVSIQITRTRSSKLGDYRAPYGKYGHRISINHDLNKYAFLITLVHELAHMVNWEKHRDRVPPHGKEWKSHFKNLIKGFLNVDIFPSDVLEALTRYLANPGASSCSDENLSRILRKYDDPSAQHTLFVEDLPFNCIFQLRNGMILRKGEQLRKRFRCKELKSKRYYLVSPIAEAVQVPVADKKGQLALF